LSGFSSNCEIHAATGWENSKFCLVATSKHFQKILLMSLAAIDALKVSTDAIICQLLHNSIMNCHQQFSGEVPFAIPFDSNCQLETNRIAKITKLQKMCVENRGKLNSRAHVNESDQGCSLFSGIFE
jgi:hypothetical protein